MKLAKFKLFFPWASVLTTIAVCAYLTILSSNDISLLKLIPSHFQEKDAIHGILTVLSLIFLLDYLVFRRHKKMFILKLQEYDAHLLKILKSKSNLQTKATTYSDHADKLKLFISDRLLEHIEYDEKFLHFRNIAAEVRHNGVISYDKVKTALETAISTEQKDPSIYSDALISMRYLWDLLDLSTTDNISMYVANKLYEAEEQYCQQLLDDSKQKQSYSPTFFAYDSVIAALPDFVNKDDIHHIKNKSRKNVVRYSDNKLWFELEKSIQLLGNINYIVLLIENLLNNALFYLNKKNYGNKYSRISISLRKLNKQAVLSIYNPGPTIDHELKDKIFQLGFSTRRNKENNGKGLGLYFVNQIVKGNEGNIEFDNIENRSSIFSLQIETQGNETTAEKINETITTTIDEQNQLTCKDSSSEGPILEYKLKKEIKSISVTIESKNKTFTLENDSKNMEAILIDPENPDIPRWCVELFKLKTMNKVIFRPLNVTGVRFTIKIPTAESRLEVSYHELESNEINKLQNPNVDFDDEDMALYR
ncbi:MAG: ATP-binding protein [Gammaproteobacteria bacterium]|nr:ATP-binding protein [Gammaproteobacteria bacterium]